MPDLQKIQRSTIYWYSVLAFVFLIPISSFLSVRVLIITLLFSFFVRNEKSANFLKEFWDVGIYFLVLIFGLIYTQDIKTGLRVIETNFSLLALPLVFNKVRHFDEGRLKQICFAFLSGLVMACLICLGYAFVQYLSSSDFRVFFFYNLADVLDLHPTYLAYYLIFAITFGLYLLNEKSTLHPALTSVTIIFFFIVLLLTGGQTAFMSLLLVSSFFILRFILEERTGFRKLTAALVSLMIIGMFLVTFVDHGMREDILNDSWDRMALWKSAVQANPDAIFGVGTGDYKIILNEYYQRHGMEIFAKDSYNSHNQFIQIFFSNGVFGLIAIIILLGRLLYTSVKNDYSFGVLVFFPFIIYGMTEVFLGRYQGIIFFFLLHQIFTRYYESVKPAFVLKGS